MDKEENKSLLESLQNLIKLYKLINRFLNLKLKKEKKMKLFGNPNPIQNKNYTLETKFHQRMKGLSNTSA